MSTNLVEIENLEIRIRDTKRNLDNMIYDMRKLEKVLESKKKAYMIEQSIIKGGKIIDMFREDNCIICRENLLSSIDGRVIIHYNCSCVSGHVLHFKCFIPLKINHSKCPICRQSINVSCEDTDFIEEILSESEYESDDDAI